MKPFSKIAAVLLALIAIMQLIRFLSGWVVTVSAFVVPLWASAVAFMITAVLALMVWREAGS